MTDAEIGKFINSITDTLNKNGYPDKKVALPLEKMYESAHNKGVNFNKVLEFLKEKGIYHTKTEEKIIFTSSDPSTVPANQIPNLGNLDMSMFKGMDMGNMMKTATEMMKNMSPDQLDNIKNQLGSLSPEQISSMQNMFTGLSDEEKKDLTEKAKNLKK